MIKGIIIFNWSMIFKRFLRDIHIFIHMFRSYSHFWSHIILNILIKNKELLGYNIDYKADKTVL